MQTKIMTMKEGDSFGALSSDKTNKLSSAICRTACEIIFIKKKDYEDLFMNEDLKKKNESIFFLSRLFPNEDFKKIVYFSCCFEEIVVEKDYIIFKENELAEEFYLILEGEVKV